MLPWLINNYYNFSIRKENPNLDSFWWPEGGDFFYVTAQESKWKRPTDPFTYDLSNCSPDKLMLFCTWHQVSFVLNFFHVKGSEFKDRPEVLIISIMIMWTFIHQLKNNKESMPVRERAEWEHDQNASDDRSEIIIVPSGAAQPCAIITFQ